MICTFAVTHMFAQRGLDLVQQFSTAVTAEPTEESGSSSAVIAASVDSGVFSLSINFPSRQNQPC